MVANSTEHLLNSQLGICIYGLLGLSIRIQSAIAVSHIL